MTIYQYRASLTASSGSVSSTTLKVRGGLLRQVYVKSNTATTVFMTNLVDDNNVTIMTWASQTGNLNDIDIAVPVQGQYTFNITNASPDDTFKILLGVQE